MVSVVLAATIACVVVGVVAPSGADAASPREKSKPTAAKKKVVGHPSTTVAFSTKTNITKINGSVPPGELLPLQNVKTLIDTIDAFGHRLVVTEGTRKAGTRVAIHVHKYGGYTCVLSGQITDFVDGREPMVHPANSCYYMPANTLMCASNLGTEDAVLIDTFNVPPGQPTITIREAGWPPY